MTTTRELIDAVKGGDAGRVADLVTADPDLASARDLDGVSALMLARYRFDRPVTDALLAADPHLDVFEAAAVGYLDRLRGRLDDDPGAATAVSSDGFTALHFAAFFGKSEAARTLIAAGAGIEAVSDNGMRVHPINSAAAGRHHEVCRVLIAAGAVVDARDAAGHTPLHEAAHLGDTELVELLLSAGADPTITQDAGATPADTAEAAGHPDVARRLREVVAERNA